jgi:hypothetical protein
MSRPVVLTLSHELGAEEARRRITAGFGRLIGQMPGGAMMQMTESWSGDRMSFTARALGQTVSGHVDVAADHVRLEVLLPEFLAGIAEGFRGKLQQAGQRLLGKGGG